MEKRINCGGRGKKSAKFWAPPFGASPFGAPLFPGLGLHPSGPTLCGPKIQHHKIGRSRNWAKSNWPNSRKKKLAEVEIGRSRSRSIEQRPQDNQGGLGAKLAFTTCPTCRITEMEPHVFRVPLASSSGPCTLPVWPPTRFSWHHRAVCAGAGFLVERQRAGGRCQPTRDLDLVQFAGDARRLEVVDGRAALFMRQRELAT